MDIKDFLSPSDVIVDVHASSKARLLEELCTRAAAAAKLDPATVTDAILRRENLGSTGMGGGVAIPHARVEGLRKPLGLLARLRGAIDFNAIDAQPVDIVFLLLLPAAPAGEQLSALASVARKLRDPDTLSRLRRAADSAACHAETVRPLA